MAFCSALCHEYPLGTSAQVRSSQLSHQLTGCPRHFQAKTSKKHSLRRRRLSLSFFHSSSDIIQTAQPNRHPVSLQFIPYREVLDTHETHRLTTPFSISATASHRHLRHRPSHHSPPTNLKHSFASHPSQWHRRYHQHCSISCLRSGITATDSDAHTGSNSQQPPLYRHPRNHILTNGPQGFNLEPLGPLGRARRYYCLLPLPRICLLVSPFSGGPP